MSAFLRQATNAARNASRVRAFSSTTVSRKDVVQEIYLREIKAYKPAPIPKDAHVGVVKAYTLPPAPKTPALPTDLAAELAAYDAQEPTIAEKPTVSVSEEEGAAGADAYLTFLEQDVVRPTHH